MRKLFTILILLCSAVCFSQAPKQLNAYAPGTQPNFLGPLATDSGFAFRSNLPDTATANLGWLKGIPNLVIVVNDSLWKRSNDATFWMRVGSGGGGGGEVLTLGTFLTGGSYDGTAPITTGIDTSDAALKAYIGHYGKDSVTTIYTGDGSLSGDRNITMNGHSISLDNLIAFSIQNDGSDYLNIGGVVGTGEAGIRIKSLVSPGGFIDIDVPLNVIDMGDVSGIGNATHLVIQDFDGSITSTSKTVKLSADAGGSGARTAELSAVGSDLTAKVLLNGETGAAAYTADTHTFNGNVLVSTLNTGGSALATSGTRQQIISDANGLLSFTNKTFATLTYGATTTWDYTTGYNKTLTLTGDADLVFSNVQSGDQGTLIVIQDGSGGHELTVPDQVITINTGAGDTTVLGFINQGGVYYWATSVASGGGGETLTISSPLTGTSYDGSAPVSIGIQNAAADATTKGASTYTAADFNATTGVISIDYTNGQAAATGAKGFLTSTDWNTFNNKAPTSSPTFTGTVTIPTPFTLGAVSVTTTGTQLNYLSSAGGTTGTTSTNIVFSTSPTLVTPVLGVATATTLNGNTFTTGTYTLTGQAGKTLTFNGSITLTGTDAQTYTFPTTSATIARTDAANTFTGIQTFSSAPVLSTGTLTANSVTNTFPTVGGTVTDYIENTSASTSSPAPTGDTRINWYQLTALAANATFSAPSGTPANHNELYIRILDNGTARTLTWNAIYRASADLPLPSTTVLSKTMYLHFAYNSASTTWDLIGLLNNF